MTRVIARSVDTEFFHKNSDFVFRKLADLHFQFGLQAIWSEWRWL